MSEQQYPSEQALPMAPRNSRRDRRWRLSRWLPTVTAAGVVAAVAVGVPTVAGAAVDLPDRTPQEVLELLASSNVEAFSGTIEQVSDLGLPSLPTGMATGTDSASLALEFLTAPHKARVYAAPGSARVQLLDQMSERNVIVSGTEVWAYDASSGKAWHRSLSSTEAPKADELPALTPAAVAEQALAAITPTTKVTVGRDGRVAGRTAYELILTPQTPDTLVESVTVSVDSQTGMPLAAEVRARGVADPAMRVAFTDLDLSTPDPSVFAFTPPAGTTVVEGTGKVPVEHPRAAGHDVAGPKVVGAGWDAVAIISPDQSPLAGANPGAGSPLAGLAAMAKAVPEGQAFTTSLISALITNDGRILVGMVPVSRLQAIAQAG